MAALGTEVRMNKRPDLNLFQRMQVVFGFLCVFAGFGLVGGIALNQFITLVGGAF